MLEGVRVDAKDSRAVKIHGVGTLRTRTEITGTPRSAQIVEEGPKRWLHIQYGEVFDAPKDPDGKSTAFDCGVTHTLTDIRGAHWKRPDSSEPVNEARRLDCHRAKCCTRGSRQWRRPRKRARALRKRVAGVQRNAECRIGQRISEQADVVGLENLALRNMNASGRGTQSVPGCARKRALNEALARARLGRFHHAIERRCLKDGTWCVKVHPGGTSITCSRCAHRDPKNRRGQRFECTACGHAAHADHNAAGNAVHAFVTPRGRRTKPGMAWTAQPSRIKSGA